jgi:pimeloyl-ACP methyl ester carboxylesterase
MAFFEHEGIQFHYEISGQGPTVALCHGLTGDLSQPKQLINQLPGYRLLFWDCRGHGATEPVARAENFGFVSFAKDLDALLSDLGIERVVVGGISMGAAVATRYAIQYPSPHRKLERAGISGHACPGRWQRT